MAIVEIKRLVQWISSAWSKRT